MKTKSIVYCFILAVGFLGSQIASAQVGPSGATATEALTLSVTGSALLAVTGPVVALSLGGAAQAGAAITPVATIETSRLRISSLASVTELGVTKTRYITASVTAGGCVGHQTVLSVQLLNPNLNFTNRTPNGGTLNGALQEVSNNGANTAAVTLVSGITTCWSGTGDDDGYKIQYKYEGVSGQTSSSSAATTITFTIVDAA